MSEPQSPEAVGSAKGPDMVANLRKVPLVEKVLAAIALVIVVGWIWTGIAQSGFFWRSHGNSASFWLSLLGALAVATIVILKIFDVRLLAPNMERKVMPIISLVPMLGLLLGMLSPIYLLFTAGGAIALAYVSATTYWKKQLPELPSAGGSAEPAAAAPPAAPPPAA